MKRMSLLFICIFFSFNNLDAADVSIPQHVKQLLEESAEQLDPITISFTWKRLPATWGPEVTLAKMKNGSKPIKYFHEQPCQITWQDGKLFSKTETLLLNDDGTQDIETIERTFDGRVLYLGNRYERDPSLNGRLSRKLLSRVTESSPLEEFYYTHDYFKYAGFRMPAVAGDWVHAKTTSTILSTLANATSATVEDTIIDDYPVLQISIVTSNQVKEWADRIAGELTDEEKVMSSQLPSKRTLVYFVDMARGGAIIRYHEMYDGNVILLRRDCTGIEKLTGRRNLWLPRKCVSTSYESGLERFSEPVLSTVVDVSSFDLSRAADSHFVLDDDYRKPGTLIQDGTVPEATKKPSGFIQYVIPARAEDLQRVIEMAKRERLGLGDLSKGGPLRTAFIVVNCILTFGIIVYLVVKRRKSTGSSSK